MEETPQHLHVRDFGPIQSCDIEVQRLTVLTGPQASGKSTLAKLIYSNFAVANPRIYLWRQSANKNSISSFRFV